MQTIQLPVTEYQRLQEELALLRNAALRQMSTDARQANRETVSLRLTTAFQLLDEAASHTVEALAAKETGDELAADTALFKVQALMPELFCYRVLGDSFGATINALHHALKNGLANPLTIPQIKAIEKALKKLRAEPFLSFDEATDMVEELEEVGLNTSPAAFKYLADWLLDD